MRKVLFGLLVLVSCTSNDATIPTSTNTTTAAIDTLLTRTEKNQTVAAEASKKGDSAVTGKIEKTAQKIEHLETQVEQLKEENHELKVKLDDVDNDAGQPYGGLPVSPN